MTREFNSLLMMLFFLAAVTSHTALAQSAVKSGDLLESGVNQANKDARLLIAVKKQNVEFAETLLSAGADPDVRSEEGWTPLLYALLNANKEMALLLIPHSDVRIYTAQALSRKQSRLRQYKSVPRSNALFLAGLRFPDSTHVVQKKILERIYQLGGDDAVLLSKLQATISASQLAYVESDSN